MAQRRGERPDHPESLMSSSAIPPQRRQAGGGRGAGANLTPAQGAEAAERRAGRPCYHAGQRVAGVFACVACQFRIRNRAALPACPDCGELIWAYMEDGPRPVPEGEAPGAAQASPGPEQAPKVEEGVKLDPTPVKVEEGVK